MNTKVHGWCDTAEIAAVEGRSESEVVGDILRGVYESPMFKNGKWFVKDSVLKSARSEKMAACIASSRRRRPKWARCDEWHDLAIVPVRMHNGALHFSFDEAARRLGTTYKSVYEMARRGRLKTACHIRHHWYVTAKEVEWHAARRRPQRRRHGRG